ncbi:MAG: hypothetical protein ACRDDY_14120 [Clostridium sp.]|uniref:hypothetical protein n=1 Tax=Clostridium sp. TaxID=1506 RepID=UPI003EE461FB
MIAYTNVISMLDTASKGQPLQVISTNERWDGVHLEPAKDRIFDTDVIADRAIYGTAKSIKSVIADAVFVKSVNTIMELADNATPVVRAGQVIAWDLDNNMGLLKICPAKAKEALESLNRVLN